LMTGDVTCAVALFTSTGPLTPSVIDSPRQ
jgi:hypothetical protein